VLKKYFKLSMIPAAERPILGWIMTSLSLPNNNSRKDGNIASETNEKTMDNRLKITYSTMFRFWLLR
jgi:hypothetical protein